MENSIEEDIKNAEHFIKSIKTDKHYKEDGWHGYFNEEIVELARILDHILSDYKRVLKENEELKELANKKQWISPCYVGQNYISKQKVKDKIEEIEQEYFKILSNKTLSLEIQNINAHKHDAMKTVLQELLESED